MLAVGQVSAFVAVSNIHLCSCVQKQDDKDAGRPSTDEGQVREETVPPNVRVMEDTLHHLDEHYGGIMGYLRHIGLTAAEARCFPVPACELQTARKR